MRALVAPLMAIGLLVAGCSSSEDPPAPAPGETPTGEAAGGAVTFVGTDGVAWAETDLRVAAGSVEVTLECGDTVPHGLAIEGVQDGEQFVGCSGGNTVTATIDVPAGTHTFFCTIPGHREAGMEGTLTAE